jgi:hypothetical protein
MRPVAEPADVLALNPVPWNTCRVAVPVALPALVLALDPVPC